MTGNRMNTQYKLVSFYLQLISEWVKPSDKLIYKEVIGMLVIYFDRFNIVPVNGLCIPMWSVSIPGVY